MQKKNVNLRNPCLVLFNPYILPLSGVTTQSGAGSDDNEGVLCIPQSSSITRTSPSGCLLSYTGRSLGEGVLSLCREAVGVFYNPGRLGKPMNDVKLN